MEVKRSEAGSGGFHDAPAVGEDEVGAVDVEERRAVAGDVEDAGGFVVDGRCSGVAMAADLVSAFRVAQRAVVGEGAGKIGCAEIFIITQAGDLEGGSSGDKEMAVNGAGGPAERGIRGGLEGEAAGLRATERHAVEVEDGIARDVPGTGDGVEGRAATEADGARAIEDRAVGDVGDGTAAVALKHAVGDGVFYERAGAVVEHP